jgi:MFS family permease
MPSAMAMGALTFQAAGMVGPAVGGALVASVGVAASYAVDAVTFGVVALAAFALRTRAERQPPTVSGLAAAKEGLRFLRDSPILLATMGLDFLANFFGAGTTLMPIFAADVLGGGPRTLGWLLSAPAVGSVVGATIMAGRRPLTRPGIAILIAIVAYGLSLVAFAFSRELAVSLACLATSGAADAVSVSQRHTLRNLLTPDRLRGRVAAAHDTFAGGGPQLGEFEAGIVASWTSTPAAVALGGVGTVMAAFAVWRWIPGLTSFRWEPERAQSPDPDPGAPASGAKSIDERGPGSI